MTEGAWADCVERGQWYILPDRDRRTDKLTCMHNSKAGHSVQEDCRVVAASRAEV